MEEKEVLIAYKKFWMNYVNFTGKTSRKEYWFSVLTNVLIVLGLVLVGGIGHAMGWNVIEGIALSIYFIFGFSVALPNIAMLVRRLRDSGIEWAFIFFVFIPFIGVVALLVFTCLPSKRESN